MRFSRKREVTAEDSAPNASIELIYTNQPEERRKKSVSRFVEQRCVSPPLELHSSEEEAPPTSSTSVQEENQIELGRLRKKSPEKPRQKSRKLRRYRTSFLEFGFIEQAGSERSPVTLCVRRVVCSKYLKSNDAMKPSKLERHLRTNHPELVDKPIEYFKRLRDELRRQQGLLTRNVTIDKSRLRTSYRISFRVAQAKEPFSIAEHLVKPCILIACEEMLDSRSAQKIKELPLSRNTIKRRFVGDRRPEHG